MTPHLALAAILEDLHLSTAAWCVRRGHTAAAEVIADDVRRRSHEGFARALTIAVEAWASGADTGPYVDAALREWRRVDGQPDAAPEGGDVFNGGALTTDHTAQETNRDH